jgi:hypothetical protein
MDERSMAELRARVERLRGMAADRRDMIGVEMDGAADDIERLADHFERVERWALEGEALMLAKATGSMFRLGALWADRPWRER